MHTTLTTANPRFLRATWDVSGKQGVAERGIQGQASIAGSGSIWMYRDPRDHDAAAAINDIVAAKMNAAVRPEWNGAEMRFEKNECPVSTARLAADR